MAVVAAVGDSEPPKVARGAADLAVEAGVLSEERVRTSLELLSDYNEERHPGHCPGRFAGPGPEYDGMEFDGVKWRMKPEMGDGGEATSTAIARLSEADQALAVKFQDEGGLALCLSSAFQIPEQLRQEARRLMQTASAQAHEGLGDSPAAPAGADSRHAQESGAAMHQAILLMQAADMAEDREAVMRNVWSDVEYNAGDAGNAELINRLEMQFASQLVSTAEVRLKGQRDDTRLSGEDDFAADDGCGASAVVEADASSTMVGTQVGKDALFQVALRDCQQAGQLAERLPQHELTNTLKEPRNLGVALDLVGAYLKNYEIDKADLVLERVVPLCRERGGAWLVKGLDKLCLVRMKQFRAQDALVCLKEIEQLAPFSPTEGWEFHDILYRNFAWCYSSLGEAKRCLEYTHKSAEVKRACGVQVSWFDIWDIGKGHSRLGQETGQRKEMRVGYDLCRKAAEIHRVAEPGDRIMLAKILSNVGEIAMGIGDSHHLAQEDDEARQWYQEAEAPLQEAFELHTQALGPMKPLSGWQAGTMSHCMVRLERWEEAREYLAMSLRVECTKDSTTPGSVIELVERMTNIHQELNDGPGLGAYAEDLRGGLAGLRLRGWDRRERDVFGLLLHKVAGLLLVADGGSGRFASEALELLREAQSHLQTHLEGLRGARELQREEEGGHADDMDVGRKRFGPRADPEELLRYVTLNIKVLELGEVVGSSASRFKEINLDSGITSSASSSIPAASTAEELASSNAGVGAAASARQAPGRAPLPTAGRPLPRAGVSGAGASVAVDGRSPSSGSSSSSGAAADSGTVEELQSLGIDLAALGGLVESDEVALSRSYALVGSWSNWSRFDELDRDPEGGTEFRQVVQVLPGQDVEFQLICNCDWKQRLFPALGGDMRGGGGETRRGILGPSSGGHGLNWRLRRLRHHAPSDPVWLHVVFDPTSGRRLHCELRAQEAGPE